MHRSVYRAWPAAAWAERGRSLRCPSGPSGPRSSTARARPATAAPPPWKSVPTRSFRAEWLNGPWGSARGRQLGDRPGLRRGGDHGEPGTVRCPPPHSVYPTEQVLTTERPRGRTETGCSRNLPARCPRTGRPAPNRPTPRPSPPTRQGRRSRCAAPGCLRARLNMWGLRDCDVYVFTAALSTFCVENVDNAALKTQTMYSCRPRPLAPARPHVSRGERALSAARASGPLARHRLLPAPGCWARGSEDLRQLTLSTDTSN
jgi:hypothetical protein